MDTWGIRKTVGAIAVAAAVAGVGGAAIAAATDVGGHGMSGGMHGPGGPGGPPPSPARGLDDDTDALHGQFVVADGHGGFATQITQTGQVTAIAATSVTARSDDGFTQTYVIREATEAAKPPFAVNDRVVIDATLAGNTATVTAIRPSFAPHH